MTVFTVAVVIRKLCAGGSVFYLGTNFGCLGISCYDCFSDGYKLTPRQLQRQRAADEAARQKLPRLIALICFCFHEGPSHNPEGMQMHQETLQCEKYAATPRCRHTRLKLINAAVPDPEQQQGKDSFILDTLGLFVACNLHFCEWAQMRPHGSASGVLLLRSTCVPIKLKISHKVEDFFYSNCMPFGFENSKK